MRLAIDTNSNGTRVLRALRHSVLTSSSSRQRLRTPNAVQLSADTCATAIPGRRFAGMNACRTNEKSRRPLAAQSHDVGQSEQSPRQVRATAPQRSAVHVFASLTTQRSTFHTRRFDQGAEVWANHDNKLGVP